MPKPVSPRLLALLQSTVPQNLYRADAYEFTLSGGGTLRYTDYDQDLTLNGNVFSSGGIKIGPYVGTADNKAKATWKTGITADTLVFDIIPGSATVLGQAFLAACQQGTFDGATLRLRRLFMPTQTDTRRGPITIFFGRVAEVDVGRSKATFTVNSWLELLDQSFPRNVYQAGCVNNLGDTPCGVNLAALAIAGVVIAGSTSSVLVANLTVSPTGEFDQGKVTFTSGTLNGISRTVKVATGGTPGSITLLYPFPSAPSAADTFNIFPGCDKTFSGVNGCPKFANQTRWRGADLIPTSETAI